MKTPEALNLTLFAQQLGVTWTADLNLLEASQSLLAMDFIEEILFEGRMGTLTSDSVIISGIP